MLGPPSRDAGAQSSRRSPTRASAPNADAQRGEVRERRAERRRRAVDRRVERLSAALNGNTNEIAAITSYSPPETAPARHEREEHERQRQREREQRGRAHLARERADRDAERREGERAERERREPQPDATPVERARTRRSRRASRRRAANDAAGREQRLLEQQPAARARARARSRASVPSSRSSATPPDGEQHADEHQRDRSPRRRPRTCSAACAARRAASLLTWIGWPIVDEHVACSSAEVLRREARRTPRSARAAARSAPGGSRAAIACSFGADRAEPDQVPARRARRGCRPLSSASIACDAAAGSVRRSRRSPARAPTSIVRVHERLLERVAVVEHFDVRRLRVPEASRAAMFGRDHDRRDALRPTRPSRPPARAWRRGTGCTCVKHLLRILASTSHALAADLAPSARAASR